jgi:cytochrome c553
MKILRAIVVGGIVLIGAMQLACAAQSEEELRAAGQAIYLEGRLPSGKSLTGSRFGTKVTGKAAACVVCHRRSGMGSVEGDELVAPITGNALFQTKGQVVAMMDPVRGKVMNQNHEPYTDEQFMHAVRKGMHPAGRMMNELMPRFDLADSDMLALTTYLRTLSVDVSPGAEEHMVHLATVVAPGVDERRRRAFLDTLLATVSQKNGSTQPGKRHMVSAAEFGMKTERNWDMNIWELKGEPSTWRAQLDEFYQAQPVFAIVSGISESTWAPVQEFCEAQKVPCWFPSVDLVPAGAEKSAYSLYFSRGVALEAAVLAEHFRHQEKQKRPQRVVQFVGAGEAGENAATTFAKAMEGTGIKVETRVLSADVAASYRQNIDGLKQRDALVLWLDEHELGNVQASALPLASLYLSGSLSGGERASLSDQWKLAVHMVYPYELPQKRGSNLAYFRTWINQRQIPLIDEPMQSEVYFSVVYFSDTVTEMLNNLYRDYLIERAENMLSKRELRKAEEETHERQSIRSRYVQLLNAEKSKANGTQGNTNRAVVTPQENLGKRTGTTVYPALGLGPGQRFASKGAYIVKFASNGEAGLAAESGWIVP